MKKTIAWILFAAIYMSLFAPLGRMVNAQTIGKTRDERLKDIAAGLKFS